MADQTRDSAPGRTYEVVVVVAVVVVWVVPVVVVPVVVVVVVPPPLVVGQPPDAGIGRSPCFRCAFAALRETRIATYGRFFEPVRWQSMTLPALPFPLDDVVVVVDVPVVVPVVVVVAVSAAAPDFLPALPLPGGGPATAIDVTKPATRSVRSSAFSFIIW